MNLGPVAALVVVQFLFGALPVASKFVLAHVHPVWLVVIRSLFAVVLFLLLQIGVQKFQTAHTSSALSRKEHVQLVMLAFFGITFNQMSLFIALPHTSAALASIISPSIAIFTLVFSVMLGKEKFHFRSTAAIALGACGVLLVMNSSLLGFSEGALQSVVWADLLNVLSAASYAMYLALVGRLPTQVGSLRFSVWVFGYGLLMNCIVLMVCGMVFGWEWLNAPGLTRSVAELSQLPAQFWAGLAFLLFGATALTYFLNLWALQRVKPSVVGGFVCLQTLFGLVLSQAILHEPLTRSMIFGSVLILCGVVLLAIQRMQSTAGRDSSSS